MSDLGVTSVETVILSVPETSRTLADLSVMWTTLEEHVQAGRIFSLGVSDLSKVQLEELYNAVKVSRLFTRLQFIFMASAIAAYSYYLYVNLRRNCG